MTQTGGMTATSNRPGGLYLVRGVNLVRCDGSTRFGKDTTNIEIWDQVETARMD